MIHPRFLFSIVLIGAAFAVVVISALRIAQPTIFLQGNSNPVFNFIAGPSITASESSQVYTTILKHQSSIDYQLPYPGILPDHPLYWLKMLRDRIQLWLTPDLKARTQLLMLYGDKRLGAGEQLIIVNQTQLGVSTITKAEKYLGQAQASLEKTVAENKADNREIQIMVNQFLKHQEVIQYLTGIVSGNDRNVLENAYNYNSLLLQGLVAKYQLQLPINSPLSSESAKIR